MSFRSDRVRIIGSVKRKEGVSKEEFENFWINEHPKLFNSLEVVKRNILKYEQAHANEVVSKALTDSGLTVAPFDAMSIFEAPTFEALMEVFTNDEYKKTVGAESLKYFERGQMFAANFVTIVDN
ncbi:hypothetical protein EDD16DRAFT_1874742 [Pisolithus croceorrhizus]|nr:hypothetical protein EDD16DRAFT_1874742 [Pisolithus croceorrhizus]KAI6122432.1 hypothetical protein EV401DRAFT_1335920 [Pisolithus croceorrhizus]KAI6161284.1 hypothetical protein EDD17DRAFT_694928 [Pisolithus thermaeus]